MKLAFLIALLAAPAFAEAPVNPLQPSASWDELRSIIIGTEVEPPLDAAVFDLEAPKRADNPALVPVRVTQPPGAPPITALVVVIDDNPAPMAGEFSFGKALMPLDFEMRVRVNTYTDLRGVATLADGRQVMAGRFVKASGGCAAPAGKSMAETRATMGQMRFHQTEEGGRTFGTLMIRHPNFSGFQRDQVSLLTIPAEFIQTLTVKQGGQDLFTMQGGISVSEDPVFRFAYAPGAGPISVHVEDTEGRVWDQSF